MYKVPRVGPGRMLCGTVIPVVVLLRGIGWCAQGSHPYRVRDSGTVVQSRALTCSPFGIGSSLFGTQNFGGPEQHSGGKRASTPDCGDPGPYKVKHPPGSSV